MPIRTTGYNIPITVATFGRNALETTQKVMKLAIERHQWRVYKEDALSMTGGPHGGFGRFCQSLNWIGPDGIEILFKPIDATTTISNVRFSIPKTRLSASKAKAEAFQRIDDFWDSLSQISSGYNLQTIRLDQYLREADYDSKDQKLFVSELKQSLFFIAWSAKCPCCGDSISFTSLEEPGVKLCQCCKRLFILRVPSKAV